MDYDTLAVADKFGNIAIVSGTLRTLNVNGRRVARVLADASG